MSDIDKTIERVKDNFGICCNSKFDKVITEHSKIDSDITTDSKNEFLPNLRISLRCGDSDILYSCYWRVEADFLVLAANSIMPIISEVERLKAELETTQTRLVQAEKDDCSRIDVIADLRAELSKVKAELTKANERIAELEKQIDRLTTEKFGGLKL